MKTNHVNFVDNSGRVYCHRNNEIADFTQEFSISQCERCPYLYGSANMSGIECLFDDRCNEDEVVFFESEESEKHSQYQYVRLGSKTKKEVDGSLQGYGAEETNIDTMDDEETTDKPRKKIKKAS